MSAPTSLLVSNQGPSSSRATIANPTATGKTATIAASKEQQQQLIDSLYATTFNADSIEIAGLEQQLKKSSSSKQVNKQHPISKSTSSHHFHRLDQIDSKFNELAKKIFDELRQAQFSREFFRAIDEILGEPPAKTFAQQRSGSGSSSRRRLRPPSYTNNNQDAPAARASNLKSAAVAATGANLVERAASQQPRSLPFEPQVQLRQTQQQQPQDLTHHKQPKQNQRQQQQTQQSRSPAKSAIPTSTIAVAAAANNLNPSFQASGGHSINRSATDKSCNLLKSSALSLQKSSTSNTSAAGNGVIKSPIKSAYNCSQREKSFVSPSSTVTPMATSSSNMSLAKSQLPISDNDADSDSDEDDDEEEDGFGLVDLRRQQLTRHSFNGTKNVHAHPQVAPAPRHPQQKYPTSEPQTAERIMLKHQALQRQQRFNPIVRSHTISGSGGSGFNGNGKRLVSGNVANGQQMTVGKHPATSVLRNMNSDYNTDHTATAYNNKNSNNTNDNNNHNHHTRLVGGVNLLNSKDAAASLSLYKPHMNYSTSVLGNHRLSDDDEIIIIPTTQSPSSLISSTSPDNNFQNYHSQHHQQHHNHQQQQLNQPTQQQQQVGHLGIASNAAASTIGETVSSGATIDNAGIISVDQSIDDPTAEELAERFSISRTKSFWEKLAKGGGGKRVPSTGGAGDRHSPASMQHDSGAHVAFMTPGNNQISDGKLQDKGKLLRFCKTTSTLERMDSTGGSNNSNYSCSSSGDENNSGSQSNQNPTLNKLMQQEMSRHSKFRQTR